MTINTMVTKIPVINASGDVAGWATQSAHKQAAKILGGGSVQQGFRMVNGKNRLCWMPVPQRQRTQGV